METNLFRNKLTANRETFLFQFRQHSLLHIFCNNNCFMFCKKVGAEQNRNNYCFTFPNNFFQVLKHQFLVRRSVSVQISELAHSDCHQTHHGFGRDISVLFLRSAVIRTVAQQAGSTYVRRAVDSPLRP
jgi:hypothetical protein